jgi:serine/threonine protein kinase/tetratricopeptide (TPR) repeat protein
MAQSSNILGKYELLEVIGDGAEGRVYKAACMSKDVPGLNQGELVALKRLKSTGHDKEFQQFRRQIEILSKLNHPNIVRYKDSFVWREKELEEDIHCLVMELLDGEPFKSLLEQNHSGLAWSQAREILLQILEALAYAAKSGVIHRDLKPSNIYITGKGVPKLIDFGIARQDDGEATATSSAAGAKGTFDYMAPDFALQHGGFRGDEQSDIFSFGVIMHFTLAGALPFPALGEQADRGYYIRWLGKQPPNPEFRNPVFKVLTHARSFIGKCIASDRESRFKTFAELMTEFQQIGYRKLRRGDETYEFTEWLGKGGFGEVYRARRMSDGKDVAVKRLFSAGQSSRFVREAKILRNAAHPNLTEYVDFVEVKLRDDEREYYLVLEYLDGMPGASLRDRIRATDNGLDPIEASQLFVCYLDCLEHLHKNGIIHRDIKPGNLYAPANDPKRAKIFDLGIAHDEEGTRTHGQVPGTLDFMPPEFATQTSGRGSPQSDIYSIGVTLYQSLTKKLPFPRLPEKESEAWVAFFKRANNPMEPTFDHPVFKENRQMASILRRALAHEPKKRFPSAGAMRDELKDFLGSIEEAPTTIIVRKPVPEMEIPSSKPVEEEDEAATKPADVFRMEQDAAKLAAAPSKPVESHEELEKKRVAAGALEKKQATDELERDRVAADQAEKRKLADAEAAKERAGRAEASRKATAKLMKFGGIGAGAVAVIVGGFFGLKTMQAHMRESSYSNAVARANDDFKSGKFADSITEANKALAIHANNAEMQQLVANAQMQVKLQQSYADAVKSAQSSFDSHDYSNALTWAAAALQKQPNDPDATKIQQNAQSVLNDYHTAVDRAYLAFKNNNFVGAVAEADKALAIYNNDPGMQQLKTRASAQTAKQQAYLDKMNSARTAYNNSDFTKAVSLANDALQQLPGDSEATKLRDAAQKFLNDFQTAVNAAKTAFDNSDFTTAESEADQALAIFKTDDAMLKLKAQAESQMKLHAAYTTEYKNAKSAFADGDFPNAISWADKALKEIPNEPNATKLRDNAQTTLDNYHAAVAAAKAAAGKGDFATALTEAEKALAIYKNDKDMEKIESDAKAQVANQQAYTDAMKNAQTAMNANDYSDAAGWAKAALEKRPNDAAAIQIRDSATQQLNAFGDLIKQSQDALRKQDFANAVVLVNKALAIHKDDPTAQKLKSNILRQLDIDLVTMLESFNVTVPAEIRYAAVTKVATLGAIGDGKSYYQGLADNLEKAYRTGNWLDQGNRQLSIHDLRKAIDNWP